MTDTAVKAELLEALKRIASGYAACDGFEDAQVIATEAVARAESQPPALTEAVALSASDRACYEYPGADEQPLRAAFVHGASLYAAPFTIQTGGDGVREAAADVLRPLIDAVAANATFTAKERDDYLQRKTNAILAALASPLVGSGEGSFSQEAKMPTEGQEAAVVGDPLPATGARAEIRNGQIVISIDVDDLPIIVSGSCATYSLHGLWKVTDAEAFAKDVCVSLNAEKEDGTTRVHMMFDGAFDHAIDQGAEGIEPVSEQEFEAEAVRLRRADCQRAAVSTAEQVGTPQGVNPTPSQQQEPGQ